MKTKLIWYFSLISFLVGLGSCNKEDNRITDQDVNMLPKKITYYGTQANEASSDSMVIFLYKDTSKVYFDSIKTIGYNGNISIMRFDYSKYVNNNLIYFETPLDTTQNIWVMKFNNGTFDNEYLYYNIYNDTYVNDNIEHHFLTSYNFFQRHSNSGSSTCCGIEYYCEYEPDSRDATRMSFNYSAYTPIELLYECTFLANYNNTQLIELSGIKTDGSELYIYPYPKLNMKLVDRISYKNSLFSVENTFEQYHYTFDEHNRVEYSYADLIYRDATMTADSVIQAKIKRRRFEY